GLLADLRGLLTDLRGLFAWVRGSARVRGLVVAAGSLRIRSAVLSRRLRARLRCVGAFLHGGHALLAHLDPSEDRFVLSLRIFDLVRDPLVRFAGLRHRIAVHAVRLSLVGEELRVLLDERASSKAVDDHDSLLTVFPTCSRASLAARLGPLRE